jgi:protein-S-isoprenylcysteine O-methyltransferase Ste14
MGDEVPAHSPWLGIGTPHPSWSLPARTGRSGTGILLAMSGSAIAVNVASLIAVALIGGYFIYSAFVEERNMTRLFPSAYPEYQQSTKMLIPFIF